MSLRVMYTNAYLSHRGYNKATGMEECMKLLLVVMLIGGFASSLAIMGFNTRYLKRFMPKRFQKSSANGKV